ncbi:MORN repeat-containing protein 1 isoform X1 [Aquarana catesbeiana]|uniref:MORN repeat-containing protein 1 isoform X1 n=1 Tax=Aquarana catesbeiana TaxID=8400 RepID=UPI003CCA2DF1
MAASRKALRVSKQYAGDVKKQLRHGYGIYVYTNSFFRYEGEWKDGKKHGHGKLLFRDGSYYEGEFVHGEITGNGLRYWATSGNKYSGEFQEGELHGHGVMQYKDGGHYEGEFVFGIREGHGLLMDKDGQTFSGAFHNNKKYGEGQMSYQNGDHYEGNWVLDQRQGHGVLHCLDGTIYEGQWRNDVFSGQGTMIHCSGVIYDGPWINGHPADIAKKIVILGGDIIDVVQGIPVTFRVQLQTEDGDVAEKENGRVLRIRAGIKYTTPAKPPSTNILELIEDFEDKPFQTPFGYECVNYPLSCVTHEKFMQEDCNAICTQPGLELSSAQQSADESEPHSEIAGDPPGGQHETIQRSLKEYPKISISEEDISLPPPNKRVETGHAVFEDVVFGPTPSRFLHLFEDADKPQSRKKASGKLSAEKTEKMTVSQEKIEDSRMDAINKERRIKKETNILDNNSNTRTGEYVIMVEDLTSPPFLGQTVQTAFKLVRLIPDNGKGKNNRKSDMLTVPNS